MLDACDQNVRLAMKILKRRVRAARHRARWEIKIGGDPTKWERLDYAYDLTERHYLRRVDQTKNLHHHSTRIRDRYRRYRCHRRSQKEKL
jgi:hypothetical protein